MRAMHKENERKVGGGVECIWSSLQPIVSNCLKTELAVMDLTNEGYKNKSKDVSILVATT